MEFTIEEGQNNTITNMTENEQFIKAQEDIFVEACEDNAKIIKHYQNSRFAQMVAGMLIAGGSLMVGCAANANWLPEVLGSAAILATGAATMAVGTFNKIADRYILLNDAKVETISKNFEEIGVECSHDDIVDDMVR